MSRVLVLSAGEIEELLTMPECIAVMEDALAALARGEVHNPLRQVIRAPNASGFLGLMPAFRGGGQPLYALKEVCLSPTNPQRGLDTHLGAVILHDGETGEPVAFLNASAITAIRTAAVSAVATRLLARENTTTLAVIGAGVQARSHLESMRVVRNFEQIRLFSRSRAKAETLVASVGKDGGPAITVCDSAEAAVRDADVIVTVTSSKQPVLRRQWIAGGAHVNAVGSSVASSRELDSETVASGSLFVDLRDSTVHESGEYLDAVREGAIPGAGHIRAEIGEILIGSRPGRTSGDEITIFKSLGLAIEDLAAGAFVAEKARRLGRGALVEF